MTEAILSGGRFKMKINKNEQGFTLIDVSIGLIVMMIGLMGLTAAIAGGIVRNTQGAQQLIAKQYASSTLESIFSARDIGDLGFDAIANRNSCPNTALPLTSAYPSGVRPILSQAGPDNIVGTCDDNGAIVQGFTRQIIITDVCDPERPSFNCSRAVDGVDPGDAPVMMRRIQVTIFYQGVTLNQLSISSQISNYSIDTQ